MLHSPQCEIPQYICGLQNLELNILFNVGLKERDQGGFSRLTMYFFLCSFLQTFLIIKTMRRIQHVLQLFRNFGI